MIDLLYLVSYLALSVRTWYHHETASRHGLRRLDNVSTLLIVPPLHDLSIENSYAFKSQTTEMFLVLEETF